MSPAKTDASILRPRRLPYTEGVKGQQRPLSLPNSSLDESKPRVSGDIEPLTPDFPLRDPLSVGARPLSLLCSVFSPGKVVHLARCLQVTGGRAAAAIKDFIFATHTHPHPQRLMSYVDRAEMSN